LKELTQEERRLLDLLKIGETDRVNELTQEECQILLDLSTLSEAPAGNLQEGKSGSKAESRLLHSRQLGRDLKDQSLYAYYRREFARAESLHKRRLLLRAARRDYELRKKGAARAKLPTQTTRQLRDEQREAQWVIEHGRGIDSALIAVDLEVPRGWVEKVRREAGYHPRTGEPLPEWKSWDDARRKQEVRRLKDAGLTNEQIGAQLGVSRETVRKYL